MVQFGQNLEKELKEKPFFFLISTQLVRIELVSIILSRRFLTEHFYINLESTRRNNFLCKEALNYDSFEPKDVCYFKRESKG